MDYLLLFVSLGIILAAAEIFTNGIEWLGLRLRLAEGAIGSILAAVGTALPESLIPLIAFIFGKGVSQQQVGIGAIIGAPFMLSTLAFFISGLVVVLDARKRPDFPRLDINPGVIQRDLLFFFAGYSLGICALAAPLQYQHAFVLLLLGSYSLYVFLTLKRTSTHGQTADLRPLLFSAKRNRPRLAMILLQIVFAVGLLVGGAELFIHQVTAISLVLGIPTFFLSLIIAPIATELPEKFNSIIWLKRRKDTLAIGNITGAMVFQSAVLPSIGILTGNWHYVQGSLPPILLTYASAGLIFLSMKFSRKLNAYVLLMGGLFYLIFLWTTLY
ncbi:MAG: sodium:calcium antiporter [Thermacetogeniaceae bacterium]